MAAGRKPGWRTVNLREVADAVVIFVTAGFAVLGASAGV
jgi:hypothetical protein